MENGIQVDLTYEQDIVIKRCHAGDGGGRGRGQVRGGVS